MPQTSLWASWEVALVTPVSARLLQNAQQWEGVGTVLASELCSAQSFSGAAQSKEFFGVELVLKGKTQHAVENSYSSFQLRFYSAQHWAWSRSLWVLVLSNLLNRKLKKTPFSHQHFIPDLLSCTSTGQTAITVYYFEQNLTSPTSPLMKVKMQPCWQLVAQLKVIAVTHDNYPGELEKERITAVPNPSVAPWFQISLQLHYFDIRQVTHQNRKSTFKAEK